MTSNLLDFRSLEGILLSAWRSLRENIRNFEDYDVFGHP
jgi:hypothetical protein